MQLSFFPRGANANGRVTFGFRFGQFLVKMLKGDRLVFLGLLGATEFPYYLAGIDATGSLLLESNESLSQTKGPTTIYA